MISFMSTTFVILGMLAFIGHLLKEREKNTFPIFETHFPNYCRYSAGSVVVGSYDTVSDLSHHLAKTKEFVTANPIAQVSTSTVQKVIDYEKRTVYTSYYSMKCPDTYGDVASS
jgi:hypothetical protein